jgi:hypothetical protein
MMKTKLWLFAVAAMCFVVGAGFALGSPWHVVQMLRHTALGTGAASGQPCSVPSDCAGGVCTTNAGPWNPSPGYLTCCAGGRASCATTNDCCSGSGLSCDSTDLNGSLCCDDDQFGHSHYCATDLDCCPINEVNSHERLYCNTDAGCARCRLNGVPPAAGKPCCTGNVQTTSNPAYHGLCCSNVGQSCYPGTPDGGMPSDGGTGPGTLDGGSGGINAASTGCCQGVPYSNSGTNADIAVCGPAGVCCLIDGSDCRHNSECCAGLCSPLFVCHGPC